MGKLLKEETQAGFSAAKHFNNTFSFANAHQTCVLSFLLD